MKTFTQVEAEAIAKKLEADIAKGSKHLFAIIRYQGQIIARYGIRRASKSVPHDYIPAQLFISPHQALDLARCPLSKERFWEILRAKGKLPNA